MQRKYNIFAVFLLLMMCMSTLFAPTASFAYTIQAGSYTPKSNEEACTVTGTTTSFGLSTNLCVQYKTTDAAAGQIKGQKVICPGEGFTTRLIPCIREPIIYAASSMLVPFSTYLSQTITAAIVLAVTVWGILIMSGKPNTLSRNGMMLGIKVGAVLLLTNNFGGLFPVFLDDIESLLNIIAKPLASHVSSDGCPTVTAFASNENNIMSMWHVVDCYLEMLVGGIFSNFTLSTGLAGFLFGLLFSDAVGFFIALIGFAMIALCLFNIARALYIFITSYIAFSFMIIISPMFIPCLLFQHTKGYFEKWLQLTISFILQPVVLFTYLVMFVVAFNSCFYKGNSSLYYAIAGSDSQADNFKLWAWIDANGISTEKSVNPQAIVIDPAAHKDEEGGNPVGTDTGVAGTQGTKNTGGASTATLPKDATELLENVGFGSKVGEALSHFKTDFIIKVVNWKVLAEKADPSGYGATTDKDAFYQNYKIRVFLAFFMALAVMYIFFSLLDYLPYIGGGVIGGGGSLPILGGDLSNTNIIGKLTGGGGK